MADDRLGQPEPVRVHDRGRGHPPGRERDPHAALDRAPDRRDRPVARSEVVRRRSSRRCRARAAGSAARARAGRGSVGPPRTRQSGPGSTRASRGQPREVGRHAAAPAGEPRRDRDGDGLALVRPDLEERDPVRRRATAGSASSSRRTTSRPSGPPSSASAGSNEARAASPAMSPLGTYGQVGAHDRRTAARRRRGRRSAVTNTIRSATPWPDGVLARELERVLRTSIAITAPHRPSCAGAGRRAARRRWPPSRSRRRRSAGPARRWARGVPASRVPTSSTAASTRCSVSGRGMRARPSVANASPWNSRKPRM